MTPNALLCLADEKMKGLFTLLLNDQGCQVTLCRLPEQAEELLLSRPCLLCILEHQSLQASEHLLRSLRMHSPGTRILLIAKRESLEELPPLIKQGIDELLLLPLHARRCTSALQNLLQPPAGEEKAAELGFAARPFGPRAHCAMLSVESEEMKRLLQDLYARRDGVSGLILRGESGAEFELLAREYHLLCGGRNPCLPRIGCSELRRDLLADLLSMGRLSDDPCQTLFIENAECLESSQQADLIAVITQERRRRDRGKPTRFVVSFSEPCDHGFIEELQLLLPAPLLVPPLRSRKADILPAAQQLLSLLSTLYPSVRPRLFGKGLVNWIQAHDWPDNHQQLVRVLSDAILHCKGYTLEVTDIRSHFRPRDPSPPIHIADPIRGGMEPGDGAYLQIDGSQVVSQGT